MSIINELDKFCKINILKLSSTLIGMGITFLLIFLDLKSILDGASYLIIGGLIFNLLVCLFVIFHFPDKSEDFSLSNWFTVVLVFSLVLLFKHNPQPKFFALASLLFFTGMIVSVVALLQLGRRISFMASNRGIQTFGLYKFVRHPLYLGELIWTSSLVLANFSLYNLLVFLLIISCQVKRIFDEEKLLLSDPIYVSYHRDIKYRLLPFLF